MGILTSYIGNQMGSNPAASTGDFLANYFGQQLGANTNNPQANVQPQSTTINYNQDGSAEVTHKQTVGTNSQPQATTPQTAVQPIAPTMPVSYQTAMANQTPQPAPQPVPGMQPFQNATQVSNAPAQVPQATAPVAPQPYTPPQAPQGVFGNMIQAESGGQQFNPDGTIVTSPKGAIGIAQVMPTTAAQPGYGVAPATPQELATPQGNMLFGQRYFEGMYNKFGQDPEKAAAAYNAGPATIERAMQTADQQGGSWKDYIPAETKDYLTKVFPKGEENIKKIQPLIAGTAGSDIGMTPEEQAIHHMVLNSGDVNALGVGTYAGDHLIDPATKKAYADQHATVLEQNKMQADAAKKAQEIVANGGAGLQRALKDESEEGSYLKAYLFQRLGLHDLAKNEQQKLGAGDQWAQTMVDGKPAWVKYNGQGAPVKGYNETGELSGQQLLNTTGMLKNAEVGTQIYADPNSTNGARYALRRINGQAQFINTATGAIETNPAILNQLTPLGVGGTIDIAAQRAYQTRGQGQQGHNAAEGYVNPPLAPNPNAPAVPVATPSAANAPAQVPVGTGAVQQSQQNQAVTNIRQPGQGPVAPSAVQVGAQTQPQTTGTYQSPAAAGAVPQPGAQGNVPIYQQKIQSERGGKRGESVDKVIDTEYREEARAGDIVSNTRKQQFAIFDRPGVNSDRLFGLYNAAAENPTDQKLAIVRDIIGGTFRNPDDVSARLAQLDLSPQEKSALAEYNIANQRINAASLKQNSGPGSISDSEQKANKEANVDITKVPALGAYNAMAQSQFTGDLARAKMDWAAGQNFSNAAQMDKAWRKEQANLTTMYADIARQRAEWIAQHGATTAAVKQGYKLYPIPQYNPNTESWEKTKPLKDIITKKSNT